MPKNLLIKLSRDQGGILCNSETFTSCMNFSKSECLAISEQAIKQCIEPLPDEIDLKTLDNDTIEACPRDIYKEAGYPDEKAQACLQKALTQK